MTRLAALLAAAMLATPALAQAPAAPPAATPPAAPTPAPPSPTNIPMAGLMSDGAQVRGGLGVRILLQLGKFVFLCRHEEGKPAVCDLVP